MIDELCCDAMLYNTYLHVMRTCNVYCYVWDPTPSCFPLVAYLTGKCLLVIPMSLGSLLLLGTRRLAGMCPSSLLCLSLRGNVMRCSFKSL